MAITRSRRTRKRIEDYKNKSLNILKGKAQGNSKELFIIKSKQKLGKRIIGIATSLILWVPMLIVFNFFISACFNYNDDFLRILKSYFKLTNEDIRYFIIISIIFFCLSFLILFIWKMYNKRRFGALNRRKEPKSTSDEEMLGLKLIEPEIYEILQAEKIIVFDKNPVRELSRGK